MRGEIVAGGRNVGPMGLASAGDLAAVGDRIDGRIVQESESG